MDDRSRVAGGTWARSRQRGRGPVGATQSCSSPSGIELELLGAVDGAVAIDPGGKVVLWNRAAERMLGYGARETVGRSCCEIFARPGDGFDCICAKGERAGSLVPRDHGLASFDLRTRTREGRPVWLNVISASTPEDTAEPLAVYLFQDVSAARDLLRRIGRRAPVPAPSDPFADLTRREREILRLVATGLGTKAMAERLRVSPATIRNHVQSILAKLGVHSRIQAIACVTRR